MPQTMPSIVSALRVRLRRERVPGLGQDLAAASLAARLVAQRLDRDRPRRRGSPDRARRASATVPEQGEGQERPTTRSAAGRRRTAAWASGSRGRRARRRRGARAPPLRNTTIIVSTKNCRTIERRVAPTALRTPISRVRSRTATSITFITPMPPMNSVASPTAPRKYFMPSVICAERLGLLDRVPDAGRLLVARVEAVDPRRARGAPARLQASWSAIERGSDQQPVDRVRRRGRLVREVAQDGAERHEHLRDVPAVVARVLLLVLHHADDRVGELADLRSSRPPRAGCRRAASCASLPRNATRRACRLVAPSSGSGPRPPGCCGSPANGGSEPVTSSDAAVVGAAHRRAALAQLGQHVRARRRLLLDPHVVRGRPLHAPAGARARRPAGSCGPAKTIMMSLPNCSRHLGLPHAQALARRHHQRDRDDAPRDAEHGEGGAQLVRGQRAQGVAEEVAEGHGCYCRTTLSPSFSPSTTSVLTPLEMPSLHRDLAPAASRAFGSGTSSEGLRSLS